MEWIKLLFIIFILFVGIGSAINKLLIYKEKVSQKGYDLVEKIEQVYETKQISSNEQLLLRKLSRKLKHQVDKEYLYDYLRKKKSEDEVWTKSFLSQSQILKPHLHTKHKKLFEQLYLIKCVGQFGLEAYTDTMIRFLESEVTTIQANAMKTLSSLGEVENCILGIEKLKERESQLSDAFLVDCLVAFKGDKTQLNEALLKKMSSHEEVADKIWMIYFEYIEYEKAAPIIHQKLVESKQKGIRLIEAIEYFAKIKYSPVQHCLAEFITEGDLNERVLAARALRFYSNEQVINSLQMALEDESYVVRERAAQSLYELLNTHENLFGMLEEKEDMSQLVDSLVAEETLKEYLTQLQILDQLKEA